MSSAGDPLVSVVIPVYNGAAFVGETVESVLAQTYRPLECIVVDDGSTDATGRILRGFGSRITYVRQTRRSSTAARNAGCRVADGEFLAFLDADDLWQPTKVERQMTMALARPELGLVYCAIEIVDEQGRHLRFAPTPDPATVLCNVLLDQAPWLGLVQTGLVPRWAFESVGGFDEHFVDCEDGDLTWRLAAQFPIAPVPQPLAKYRTHPGQKSRDIQGFGREWKLVLDKAFASGLLPPEVQALEGQARAKLTLGLAYDQLRVRPMRSLTRVGEALRLSPPQVGAWILWLGQGRLRRFWRERRT